jgi:hypothetical protein
MTFKVMSSGDPVPNSPSSWVLSKTLAKFWKLSCHNFLEILSFKKFKFSNVVTNKKKHLSSLIKIQLDFKSEALDQGLCTSLLFKPLI